MYIDKLIYWVSIDKPAVKMASLNGTGQATLLNESNAEYTGITLYNNCLYISDESRRSSCRLPPLVQRSNRICFAAGISLFISRTLQLLCKVGYCHVTSLTRVYCDKATGARIVRFLLESSIGTSGRGNRSTLRIGTGK